jgi:pyridoxamine 5'-phosphate oxidase
MSFEERQSMSAGFAKQSLSESDARRDPFEQFHVWMDEAVASGMPIPDAMTLATATTAGAPSARQVLLRGLDRRGFVFFTNYQSRKSKELQANPNAALLFYWPALERQVRIEGSVERVTAQESDAYFRTRPRGSRLSAWASPQSEVIANRELLERRMEQLQKRYPTDVVPRPPYWGGYRVRPTSIEFWQGGEDRLHDRLRYTLKPDGSWHIERLAP